MSEPSQQSTDRVSSRPSPLRQGLIYGTLVGVGIAVVMGVMMSQSSRGDMIDDPVRDLPPLAGMPLLGDPELPLIQVIYDYKCPVCATFEESVMPGLLKGVVARKEAAIEARPYPFLSRAFGLEDDDSFRGAAAGLCVFNEAGPEVFFSFTRQMFKSQGDEREVWITPSALRSVAGQVMPAPQVTAMEECLEKGETRQLVAASLNSIEKSGINSTPTVLVGSRLVLNSGGRPSWRLSDIEAEVQAQRTDPSRAASTN